MSTMNNNQIDKKSGLLSSPATKAKLAKLPGQILVYAFRGSG